MTTIAKPVSLREHVVPVEAGEHVVGAQWLKATLALALAGSYVGAKLRPFVGLKVAIRTDGGGC